MSVSDRVYNVGAESGTTTELTGSIIPDGDIKKARVLPHGGPGGSRISKRTLQTRLAVVTGVGGEGVRGV